MTEEKKRFIASVESRADELFAIGCDIFDHPEYKREEYHAAELLTAYLEKQGFAVEKGLAGMPTAFRAVWERGKGGPSIGFMVEYDALVGLGHACGHHLQGPAGIGAALALREVCDKDVKIVVYGTPDEEHSGGKIDMAEQGFFTDVDVMFSCHTSGRTFASFTSKALAPNIVTFHGKPAHASGAPFNGRSAMDAMLLAFHGLEVMREHVKDGCRIHYTILEGTGPSNIVHEKAKAHITLRAPDRFYLEDMRKRLDNILRGACLMTDTTFDINPLKVYWNVIPVPSLRKLGLDIAEEVGAKKVDRSDPPGGGSTDVGNVSWVVPTLNMNVYFCDFGGHTAEYCSMGKTENARDFTVKTAEIMGLSALTLVNDPALLAKAKAEHKIAITPAE